MNAARLTVAQKVELWRRWRKGQSLSKIGRALTRSAPAIFSSVRHAGGFSPRVRVRSPRHLSSRDREKISRGMAQGKSMRQVAREIGRAPSTISRELGRNLGRVRYRAVKAEYRAAKKAARPKLCALQESKPLRDLVARKLMLNWSPQQIAGYLRHRKGEYVSHETIYRSLFIQARNVLKKELCAHLRTRRQFRKGKNHTNKRQGRNSIKKAISISKRPASVEKRAVPGHWEGDLITGSGNTHIATLVERKSRFVILVKVKSKDTVSVVAGLTREIKKLPRHLRRTLTWDRGLEMASHDTLTVATDIKVYFCDPHSPWQRGSNENTNGLLRQYFPKRTSLAHFSQADLNKVASQLNDRPRKTLDYRSPAEVLQKALR